MESNAAGICKMEVRVALTKTILSKMGKSQMALSIRANEWEVVNSECVMFQNTPLRKERIKNWGEQH